MPGADRAHVRARLRTLLDDDLRFVAHAVWLRDPAAARALLRHARPRAGRGACVDVADVVDGGGVVPDVVFDLAAVVDAGGDSGVVDVPRDLRGLLGVVEAAGLLRVSAAALLWPVRARRPPSPLPPPWWLRAELSTALRHGDDRDWDDLVAGVARELWRLRRRPLPLLSPPSMSATTSTTATTSTASVTTVTSATTGTTTVTTSTTTAATATATPTAATAAATTAEATTARTTAPAPLLAQARAALLHLAAPAPVPTLDDVGAVDGVVDVDGDAFVFREQQRAVRLTLRDGEGGGVDVDVVSPAGAAPLVRRAACAFVEALRDDALGDDGDSSDDDVLRRRVRALVQDHGAAVVEGLCALAAREAPRGRAAPRAAARIVVDDGPRGFAFSLVGADGRDVDVRAVDEIGALDADTRAVARLLARHTRRVGAHERARLVPALVALARRVPLMLPPSVRGPIVDGDRRLVVRLTPRAGGGLRVDVGVRPLPGAPFCELGRTLGNEHAAREGAAVDDDLVTVIVDGNAQSARRDRADEARRREALAERGVVAGDIDDDDAALDVVVALGELGAAVRVEWPADALTVVPVRAVRLRALPGPPGRARVRIDVDVDVDADVDDDALVLAALLHAAKSGRRYARLSKQRFLRVTAWAQERVAPLVAFGAPGTGDDADTIDVPAVVADVVCGDVDDSVAVDDSVPDGVTATLRPYQRAGLAWMRRLQRHHCGAVLADEMGLGKTVQALAALVDRQARGPQLVVTPASMVQVWRDEAARHAPALRMRGDLGGADGDLSAGDVVVISWSKLVLAAPTVARQRFATVVFDEAQALKNVSTQRVSAARAVDAAWRLALTGTPLENHAMELWSLLEVVTPGVWGTAQAAARAARPRSTPPTPAATAAPTSTTTATTATATIPTTATAATTATTATTATAAWAQATLALALKPFVLRRTKAMVLPELPPRTEVTERVELADDERAAYDAVCRVIAHEARGASRVHALRALTRLRLRACDPLLDDAAWLGSRSKLERASAVIVDLVAAGHRVLVFSSFVRVLAQLRARVSADGARTAQLDGSTPRADRAARIAALQEGALDAFFVSLKAGGTGLTLTGADVVVLYDPWWNEAAEQQAADRVHRIGQAKPVTVVRFIAAGTIEDAVVGLQRDKRAVVDAVLAGVPADVGGAGVDVDAALAALLRRSVRGS
jgi:superfamily II DNA or RNA helicase